jgi:hypothetical protein
MRLKPMPTSRKLALDGSTQLVVPRSASQGARGHDRRASHHPSLLLASGTSRALGRCPSKRPGARALPAPPSSGGVEAICRTEGDRDCKTRRELDLAGATRSDAATRLGDRYRRRGDAVECVRPLRASRACSISMSRHAGAVRLLSRRQKQTSCAASKPGDAACRRFEAHAASWLRVRSRLPGSRARFSVVRHAVLVAPHNIPSLLTYGSQRPNRRHAFAAHRSAGRAASACRCWTYSTVVGRTPSGTCLAVGPMMRPAREACLEKSQNSGIGSSGLDGIRPCRRAPQSAGPLTRSAQPSFCLSPSGSQRQPGMVHHTPVQATVRDLHRTDAAPTFVPLGSGIGRPSTGPLDCLGTGETNGRLSQEHTPRLAI